MAQQDITGLLTGMFSGDPAALNQKLLAQKAVASNPNLLATTQTQIGNAPEQLARMRQSVGGMFGQDKKLFLFLKELILQKDLLYKESLRLRPKKQMIRMV